MPPRHTTPSGDQEKVIYAILVWCGLVLLWGMVRVFLEWLGDREPHGLDEMETQLSDDCKFSDSLQSTLTSPQHADLTDVDREGYGAVGIRVDPNLIRKAWTADGREVDYLSD